MFKKIFRAHFPPPPPPGGKSLELAARLGPWPLSRRNTGYVPVPMRFLRPLRFYVCGIGCPCQGVAPPRFDVLGVRHPSQGIVSPSALMCWGLSHPTMELHVSFYCRLRALDTLKECHFSLTSTSWGVRCPRKGIASRSSLTSWGSDTPEGCQVSLYFDVLRGQIPFQGGRAP